MNFYTKGCKNNLFVISTKKTVLILIFGLLQPFSTNLAKLLQYQLMFRETEVTSSHKIEYP